jgi:hypothetical protein
MYKFFHIFFVNFVSSCARYIHGEPMCTGYVTKRGEARKIAY